MKIIRFILFCLTLQFISCSSLLSQEVHDNLNCYSILVGKEASKDGSVLFAHNEDDYGTRIVNWYKVPGRKHGQKEKFQLKNRGEIDQATETYSYLWLEMPEMEVPPLRPPTLAEQMTPEAPTLEIDMKSLSASSVPLAVNVPRTVAKAPTMQQDTSGVAKNHEYSMGDVDSKPGALGQALPLYPRRARRRGIEGWVKVRFLVTKDGRVRNLSVLKESPTGVFHKTVMNTVPRWRFKPARKDGQAVNVWVEQTINFKLEK